LGKIVELARDTEICRNPQHPYTKALMAAIPIPKARSRKATRQLLAGDVPNPINLPTGCSFHPRCLEMLPRCRDEEPSMVRLDENREVACHLFS
ncbi:MAG: ABC transporter ATP-binding protein, partial [Deltaproteobacteria bacterium]|nr:ABC transporter ATP-binding protein [Deltaproteobacteria bacterium]